MTDIFSADAPEAGLAGKLIFQAEDPVWERGRQLKEETKRLEEAGGCSREEVLERLCRMVDGTAGKDGTGGKGRLCMVERSGEDCMLRIRAHPLAMAVLLKQYDIAEKLIRAGERFHKKKCEITYLNTGQCCFKHFQSFPCDNFRQEYPNSVDFLYGCPDMPDELRFLYLEEHPEDRLLGSVAELLTVMGAGHPVFPGAVDWTRFCRALAQDVLSKSEPVPEDDHDHIRNVLRVLKLFAERYGKHFVIFDEIRRLGPEAALKADMRRLMEPYIAAEQLGQAHLLLLRAAEGEEPIVYHLNCLFLWKLYPLIGKADQRLVRYYGILVRWAVSDRIRIKLLCYAIDLYQWIGMTERCAGSKSSEWALCRRKLEKFFPLLMPPDLSFSRLCEVGIPCGDGVVLYLRRSVQLPMVVHENCEEEWRFALFMIEGYQIGEDGLPLRQGEAPEVEFEELFDRFVCPGSKLTKLHKCVLDMNSEEKTRAAVRTGLIHSENREACIRYAIRQKDLRALPAILFLDVKEPEREENG